MASELSFGAADGDHGRSRITSALELHIAVTTLIAEEGLNEILKKNFGIASSGEDIVLDDVVVTIFVENVSTITLERFESMRRITDWDLLSGLEEEAQAQVACRPSPSSEPRQASSGEMRFPHSHWLATRISVARRWCIS